MMKITTSDLMMLLSKSCFNSKGMTFAEVARALTKFMQDRGLEIEDPEERGWLPIKVFEWYGDYADLDYLRALKVMEGKPEKVEGFANYEAEREKVGRLLEVRGKPFMEVYKAVAKALKGKVFMVSDPVMCISLYFYEKYGDKEDANYKHYSKSQPKDPVKPVCSVDIEADQLSKVEDSKCYVPAPEKLIPNYKEFLWWIAGRVCSEGCTVESLTDKISLEMKLSSVKYGGALSVDVLPEKAAKELLGPTNQYNIQVVQRAKERKYHTEPNARVNLMTTPKGMESPFIKSAFRTKEQNELVKMRANPDNLDDALLYAFGAMSVNYANVFKSTQPKETTVSTKPIETITYIYGQPVNAMTEDELISAIKRMEAEIAEYRKVKAVSAKINSRIKDLETAIETATAALDSK